MSAASFDSTDPNMAAIVHRACGDHPKFFVDYHHSVDLLFCRSDFGELLVVLKLCR